MTGTQADQESQICQSSLRDIHTMEVLHPPPKYVSVQGTDKMYNVLTIQVFRNSPIKMFEILFQPHINFGEKQ